MIYKGASQTLVREVPTGLLEGLEGVRGTRFARGRGGGRMRLQLTLGKRAGRVVLHGMRIQLFESSGSTGLAPDPPPLVGQPAQDTTAIRAELLSQPTRLLLCSFKEAPGASRRTHLPEVVLALKELPHPPIGEDKHVRVKLNNDVQQNMPRARGLSRNIAEVGGEAVRGSVVKKGQKGSLEEGEGSS